MGIRPSAKKTIYKLKFRSSLNLCIPLGDPQLIHRKVYWLLPNITSTGSWRRKPPFSILTMTYRVRDRMRKRIVIIILRNFYTINQGDILSLPLSLLKLLPLYFPKSPTKGTNPPQSWCVPAVLPCHEPLGWIPGMCFLPKTPHLSRNES